MKLKFFGMLLTFVLSSTFGLAVNTVEKSLPTSGTAKDITSVTAKTLTKSEARAIHKAERKEVRNQKRMAMVQKFMAKKMNRSGVDFKDPVNKWLWFAVFGWGIGLVIWIIAAAVVTGGGFLGGGVLGLLASLAWLAGTVAFVIWLVKKFGDA